MTCPNLPGHAPNTNPNLTAAQDMPMLLVAAAAKYAFEVLARFLVELPLLQ